MPFTSSRTVRTITIDSDGRQRVQTKTYRDGEEEGDAAAQGFGFNTRFGGMNIRMGGGDDGDRRTMSNYRSSSRPQVDGRTTRKEKKNPFSGLSTQSYDVIVKRCKEEGILFEDPEFLAEDGSIFFSRSPPRPFEWKRPTELCDNPMYVASGASRFDVQQGELGDCWLLAAVASLTCNHHLLNKVIIPEQDFSGPNYVGCFKFLFWHQGDWIEVVVDDRLPTFHSKLVFMHSADQNEFWSALLEKAYAKINGSYESLKGGSTSEAMEDFTGGVTESIDLGDRKPELLTIMMKAFARGSLMGCSIDADPNQLEAILDNGLVMGHAYSVTAVKLVEIQTPKVSGKIPMVRVRNPWGNESEWNGAWSDKSAEWNYIPADEKKALGLTFDDDGEFWMSFEDWQRNFQKLEICNLGPDSLDEEESASGKIRWEATAEKGEWIPRVNAGGCRNYLDTFATNPQYRVVLTDSDDDDDDLCTILIGLLQKDRRKKRKEGLDMLTMGYVIYKMKEDGSYGSAPLDTRFFKYNASCAKSPSFINMREVCGRHKLAPGTYVIIPSTFEPNQAGEFLLRIFTEKPGVTSEMDEGTAIVEDQHKQTEQHFGIHTEQADPYRDQDPPSLGFDMIYKSDYKRPDPFVPYEKYGIWGAPGTPYGPPQGYSPAPYSPYSTVQGYDPNNSGQPAANYSGYGYQTMPGTPYNSQPGYQPYPNQPPDTSQHGYQMDPNQYYNYPNPAYNVGYQPTPYSQMPTPGSTGYQQNTFPNQYCIPESRFGPSQGQYNQTYGWPSDSPGHYNPSQTSYPYGQGEAMQQAQCSSLNMAAPSEVISFNTGVTKPMGSVSQPAYKYTGASIMPSYVAGVAAAPPSSHAQAQQQQHVRKAEPVPVTEEDKQQGQAIKEAFKQIAGEDMEIDAQELRDILNKAFQTGSGALEFQFDGFSMDVCRSMIAMHDGDMSGKLGFDEFKDLWNDIRKWKTIFKKHDRDNSGKLSSYELRDALHASGFRLSNRTLSSIILRYSDKSGQMEFDDFILCAIRLKTMITSFRGLDTNKEGVAVYDLETFIQTTIYS